MASFSRSGMPAPAAASAGSESRKRPAVTPKADADGMAQAAIQVVKHHRQVGRQSGRRPRQAQHILGTARQRTRRSPTQSPRIIPQDVWRLTDQRDIAGVWETAIRRCCPPWAHCRVVRIVAGETAPKSRRPDRTASAHLYWLRSLFAASPSSENNPTPTKLHGWWRWHGAVYAAPPWTKPDCAASANALTHQRGESSFAGTARVRVGLSRSWPMVEVGRGQIVVAG